MSASRQFFIQGFDPTGDPDSCITRAQLLQMIAAAYLMPDLGGFVWADAAPDVTTFPELAKYVWIETVADVPTGDWFYYNGTSWTQFTAAIPDNSITLDKWSLSGANPFDIVQLNSAGTAWTYVQPENALQDGTVPLAKLADATNGDFLYFTSGAWTATAFNNAFLNTIITALAVAKLAPGTPGQFLKTVTGPTVQWSDFDSGIPPITGITDALKFVRVNAAGDAYELVDPTSIMIPVGQISGGATGNTVRWTSGGIAVWQGKMMTPVTVDPVPTTAGQQLLTAHGLGAAPDRIDALLICDDAGGDAGFTQNRRLQLHSIVASVGGTNTPKYQLTADATNIYLLVVDTSAGSIKASADGTSGAQFVTFDPTKWKIRVTAEIIS